MLLLLKWGEEINYSFCMFNRNCIFNISIIINIAFVVVVVIFQNHQVMVTSFGCCWYSGCSRQSLYCLSSCIFQGKMGVGRWRVIVVLLWKIDVRNICEIKGESGADPNDGMISFPEKLYLSVMGLEYLGVGFGLVGGDTFNFVDDFGAVV